jgi:long-chain acyl-CoA synthetase
MKIDQEQKRFNEYTQLINPHGTMMYIGHLLQRAARLWPQRIALICQQETITYHDLYYRSLLFGKQLRALGSKPRDRIIIAYENSIPFYIAYFAAWQCGAIVAPVNTLLHEKELAHIIGDAQPTILILSAKQHQKVQKLGLPLPPVLSEEAFNITSSVPSVIDKQELPTLDQHEMCALLYTSGTTGMPKGVMLSSHAILTNLIQGVARLEIFPNDRAYCALPLFHSLTQNTCVWGAFFMGVSVILVPKIDRSSLIEGLSHKPTIMIGVPALYGFFARLRHAPFHTVRYFFCGGDALPDKIRLYFELLYRRKLCNGYGLTETAPLISIDMQDHLVPTHTVGKPVIGITCQLRDEEGQILTKGIGTLFVTGPNLMLGYYNAPQATADVLKDGWLNTGDLAYIDPQGNIVICGRERDLIANKGLKIYPQEVENILMTHPAVIMAAVVGKPDSYGEVPVAFIMTKESIPDLADQLRTLCTQNLAAYKIPHDFIIVHDLPLTSTGKADKKELRKQLKTSKNTVS